MTHSTRRSLPRDNGFWVGIGIDEQHPRSAHLGAVSTTDRTGDAPNSHASPSKKHKEAHPYAASASAPTTATCRPRRRLRTPALPRMRRPYRRRMARSKPARTRRTRPAERPQPRSASPPRQSASSAPLWREAGGTQCHHRAVTMLMISRRRLTAARGPHSFAAPPISACKPFVPGAERT